MGFACGVRGQRVDAESDPLRIFGHSLKYTRVTVKVSYLESAHKKAWTVRTKSLRIFISDVMQFVLVIGRHCPCF